MIKPLEKLSDSEWQEYLLRSLHQNVVGGIKFPKFPSKELQANFVGSSDESALIEGFKFYEGVKTYIENLREDLDGRHESRFLDSGCGWGRFMRIFRKDFHL
jgi:hypothetical protein